MTSLLPRGRSTSKETPSPAGTPVQTSDSLSPASDLAFDLPSKASRPPHLGRGPRSLVPRQPTFAVSPNSRSWARNVASGTGPVTEPARESKHSVAARPECVSLIRRYGIAYKQSDTPPVLAPGYEELKCDVVRISKRQCRVVRRVHDAAVGDPEFVQTDFPCL